MTLPEESIFFVEMYLLECFKLRVTEFPSQCGLNNTFTACYGQKNRGQVFNDCSVSGRLRHYLPFCSAKVISLSSGLSLFVQQQVHLSISQTDTSVPEGTFPLSASLFITKENPCQPSLHPQADFFLFFQQPRLQGKPMLSQLLVAGMECDDCL